MLCLEKTREMPEPTGSPHRQEPQRLMRGNALAAPRWPLPSPRRSPPDLWRGVFFSKASCRGRTWSGGGTGPCPQNRAGTGRGIPAMEEEEGGGRCAGTQTDTLGTQREHEKMLFYWGGWSGSGWGRIPIPGDTLNLPGRGAGRPPTAAAAPGFSDPRDPSAPTRMASTALSSLEGNQ